MLVFFILVNHQELYFGKWREELVTNNVKYYSCYTNLYSCLSHFQKNILFFFNNPINSWLKKKKTQRPKDNQFTVTAFDGTVDSRLYAAAFLYFFFFFSYFRIQKSIPLMKRFNTKKKAYVTDFFFFLSKPTNLWVVIG